MVREGVLQIFKCSIYHDKDPDLKSCHTILPPLASLSLQVWQLAAKAVAGISVKGSAKKLSKRFHLGIIKAINTINLVLQINVERLSRSSPYL